MSMLSMVYRCTLDICASPFPHRYPCSRCRRDPGQLGFHVVSSPFISVPLFVVQSLSPPSPLHHQSWHETLVGCRPCTQYCPPSNWHWNREDCETGTAWVLSAHRGVGIWFCKEVGPKENKCGMVICPKSWRSLRRKLYLASRVRKSRCQDCVGCCVYFAAPSWHRADWKYIVTCRSP